MLILKHFFLGLSAAVGVFFFSIFDFLVVCALAFAILINGASLKPSSDLRVYIYALSLWLCAQVFSDFLNDTSPRDMLSRSYLILISILVLYFLDQRYTVKSYSLFLLFCSAVMLATALMRLNGLDINNGTFVFKACAEFLLLSLLAFLAAYRCGRVSPGPAVLLGLLAYAVASVIYDARIFFGSALFGLLCYFIIPLLPRKVIFARIPFSRGGVLSIIVLFVVSFAALGGAKAIQDTFFIGSNTKRYAQQEGRLGLLVGSRVEILGTLAAIQDRPVIGHGSWATNYNYVSHVEYARQRYGYQRSILGNEIYSQSYRIPNHSFIFGSWMESGLGGGFAWAVILFYSLYLSTDIFSHLSRRHRGDLILASIVGVSIFMLSWNIAFSTLSNDRRLYVPVTMFFLVLTRRFLRDRDSWHND